MALVPEIRAARAAMVLAGTGSGMFVEDLAQMGLAGGATGRALGQQMNTTAYHLTKFRQQWDLVKESFGRGFLPVLTKILQKVTEVMDRLRESGAFERLGETFAKLLEFVPAAIDRIVPMIPQMFERVKGYVQGFARWLWDNWDAIWTAAGNVVQWVLGTISTLWGQLMGAFASSDTGSFSEALATLAYDFDALRLSVQLAWEELRKWIETIKGLGAMTPGGIVKGFLAGGLQGAQAAGPGWGAKMVGALGGAARGAMGVIPGAIGGIQDAWGRADAVRQAQAALPSVEQRMARGRAHERQLAQQMGIRPIGDYMPRPQVDVQVYVGNEPVDARIRQHVRSGGMQPAY